MCNAMIKLHSILSDLELLAYFYSIMKPGDVRYREATSLTSESDCLRVRNTDREGRRVNVWTNYSKRDECKITSDSENYSSWA